jgi:hypothetical protein
MDHSKTPNFDTALDAILSELVPHGRTCRQKELSRFCEGEFKIVDKDIEFFKLLRVPPPTLCPTCRRQKRFAFVNRCSFYKRKNDAPDAKGPMISYVPPNSPFVVYDLDYYRSANWDPLTYGTTYTEDVSFFDQFFDLRLKVPQPGILRDPSNVNYEYSLNGKNSKNVYCSSGVFDSEDVWYTIFCTKSRQIMDSQKPTKSENCYNIFFTNHASNCFYLYYSADCIDSWFLYNCRNCQNCFGCVNLRNKNYCWFNEQLSKEEYEKRFKEFGLDKRSVVEKVKEEFWVFVKSHPVLASRSVRAINSNGVVLTDCNDCTNCVSAERCEHERYCDSVISHKDSMDVYASGASDLTYESTGSGGQASNVKFMVISKTCINSEYLINCRLCENCFGCIALENKKYCIFNKQYEPEEYYKELDRVKTAMLTNGEYGEFYPYKFSAFAYNGADVDIAYPLEKEEVEKLGALWQEHVATDTAGLAVLAKDQVPDSITDVTDDILNQAIICEVTGKPFRVIKTELEFYRRHGLPLPTIHPYERMRRFFAHMGNHLMRQDVCESCGAGLQTIYPEGEGWRLHCETCFNRQVL